MSRFDITLLKEIVPEVRDFALSRYPLPNLAAVNFVIHQYLGWGVASNLRLDSQAKGLAELVRSRVLRVPAELVAHGRPSERFSTLGRTLRARFKRNHALFE